MILKMPNKTFLIITRYHHWLSPQWARMDIWYYLLTQNGCLASFSWDHYVHTKTSLPIPLWTWRDFRCHLPRPLWAGWDFCLITGVIFWHHCGSVGTFGLTTGVICQDQWGLTTVITYRDHREPEETSGLTTGVICQDHCGPVGTSGVICLDHCEPGGTSGLTTGVILRDFSDLRGRICIANFERKFEILHLILKRFVAQALRRSSALELTYSFFRLDFKVDSTLRQKFFVINQKAQQQVSWSVNPSVDRSVSQ